MLSGFELYLRWVPLILFQEIKEQGEADIRFHAKLIHSTLNINDKFV